MSRYIKSRECVECNSQNTNVLKDGTIVCRNCGYRNKQRGKK